MEPAHNTNYTFRYTISEEDLNSDNQNNEISNWIRSAGVAFARQDEIYRSIYMYNPPVPSLEHDYIMPDIRAEFLNEYVIPPKKKKYWEKD